MYSNRVLRKFDADYACRVSFRDDNNQKLSSCPDPIEDSVYLATVEKPMLEGLQIGPRLFEFLGWSNSQIRDHGVWMYARDESGNTSQTIREWMGDFSCIRSIPRLMARMGQCFSKSEESVNIPLNEMRIRTEPDVLGGMNPMSSKPYTFSEGIGRIGKLLMQKVSEAMNYKNSPSALQIRYAGYKGMLVLDPTLPDDLDIVFRRSMKKFDCKQSQSLEIVKVSTPLSVFMNRNLITILAEHGVPPGSFFKLQEDILKNLADILLHREPAVKYLKSNCHLKGIDFERLAECGICPISEPFFRAMLIGLHKNAVEQIKKRTRLEIPSSHGRNMFGVLDETRTLDYGQVFVQYTKEKSDEESERKILTGPVLVTKNPCLLEGDVRMFVAVDVPGLHHIVDCVVFPQKGKRPHPNEMAGSDLDGDEYAVIWYKPFFFERNAEPSHFPSANELFSSQYFKVEEMISFLCYYVRNDQVGLIGNAHLAKADELGLGHSVCQSIAQKFSVAVDFLKTGQMVTLDKEERPSRYPDFMGKEHYADTYRSGNVLGKLFRICKSFQIENSSAISYEQIKVDQDLIVPGWTRYEKEAVLSRDRYNNLVESLLTTYGVDHEAEAMSHALTIHGRLQARRDKAEVQELIRKSIGALWKNMNREFFEEFKGSQCPVSDSLTVDDIILRILQKASAWYVVTYSSPRATFLSFPWVVSSQLALIKSRNLSAVPGPAAQLNTAVQKLDEQLIANIGCNQLCYLDSPSYTYVAKCCTANWCRIVLASRVLVHWAEHHQLISNPTAKPRGKPSNDGPDATKKTVQATNLVVAFVNVATRMPEQSSVVEMLLCFFRHCISLRFVEAYDLTSPVPVSMKLFKVLGKKSMLAYHSIVFSGDLGILGLNVRWMREQSEGHEMEPVRLPRKLASKYRKNDFQSLKKRLETLSGVAEVQIRGLSKGSALVSANGSPSAIVKLRNLISKELCLEL